VNLDFNRINKSKLAYRQKLAALPIAEKLAMLDALRERTLAIRANVSPKKADVSTAPIRAE
jgi:hypothetical protein